jgi:hypothetical protein
MHCVLLEPTTACSARIYRVGLHAQAPAVLFQNEFYAFHAETVIFRVPPRDGQAVL